MMRFTVEKWKCDRCHLVLDAEPKRGFDRYEILLSGAINYNTAAGPSFEFRDMCDSCFSTVEGQIMKIIDSAKEDRSLHSKAKLDD